jgi:hypothetical protein
MPFDSTKSCLPYTKRSCSNDRRSRDTVGSCVRALAWKSYRSLRTTAHLARGTRTRRLRWPTFSTVFSAESWDISPWPTQW